MDAATPCKQNITRSAEMPVVPTLPRSTPHAAHPRSAILVGSLPATSGRKLTKVHPLIG